MKNSYLRYSIFLLILALSVISCSETIKSKGQIANYSIEISNEVSKQNKSNITLCKLTGNTMSSAFWIYSYKVEYNNDKIFIIIEQTLQKTGISSPYFIQFIVPEEVTRIYLGREEVIWQRPK